MHDNGGGTAGGSELVPAENRDCEKAIWRTLDFRAYVDIREGDARVTLSDLGGPVDFVLIDEHGQFPSEPSLARDLIQVIAPQILYWGLRRERQRRTGFSPKIHFAIRQTAFISVNLPLKSGTELCVKVS